MVKLERTIHQGGGTGRRVEENNAEKQTLEKRNQREVGSEDGRKIQRFRGTNQRLLKSKVNGKTCTSAWKNQEQTEGRMVQKFKYKGRET